MSGGCISVNLGSKLRSGASNLGRLPSLARGMLRGRQGLLQLRREPAACGHRQPRGHESAAAPELHPKQEGDSARFPAPSISHAALPNAACTAFARNGPQTARGTAPFKVRMNGHMHMSATLDKMAAGVTAATHCRTLIQKAHCPRPL
jgi:hypothetical protein